MRHDHDPGGLVGSTLKAATVKRWALSLHHCSQLVKDLVGIKGSYDQVHVISRKEESDARKHADETDRKKSREKLSSRIDPLSRDEHQNDLFSIASGMAKHSQVNVDEAVTSGNEKIVKFHESWPARFQNPIRTRVKTMSDTKKGFVIHI